jgi:hypothetical protein
MGEKKQIAYFYNAKMAEKETDVDYDGELAVPEKGQVLRRPDGKDWKVEAVMMEQVGRALPVYKVYFLPA